MDIRELLEQNEHQTLSKRAQFSDESRAMMSISPPSGHPDHTDGIIQNAGQVPLPLGSFRRASKYP